MQELHSQRGERAFFQRGGVSFLGRYGNMAAPKSKYTNKILYYN